jgi:multisubunit Na+/H+ antiporter MnhC subunit
MSKQMATDESQAANTPATSPLATVLMTMVIVLSLAACGLMLLVPTRSISVTTVYKGF